MGFEENEISINSQGGTELTKRNIASKMPPELANEFQIICSRLRNLEEDKIRVYWLHDLPEDPEINHLKDKSSRDRFHKFVFSSQWQYERFRNVIGMPYDDKSIVIETCVDPIEHVEKSKDEIRLIYTSTPQRGLSILVPVFEKLAEKYDNIYLDVFSSFKIYGWEESDKQFEPLYERCRNHPRITYHSFEPNDVVRATLQKAHILAYPSIWMETSCRSVIEGMSAGLLCVHPNLGALSDTSGGLNFMYQGHADHNKHANIFYQALDDAIQKVNRDDVQSYLKLVKMYADSRFGTYKVAQQWQDLLEGLHKTYETVGSRKLPSAQMFRYNT